MTAAAPVARAQPTRETPSWYTWACGGVQSSRVISVESANLRRALDRYPGMGFKMMKALSSVMATRLHQTTSSLISKRESALVRVLTSELDGQD